MGSFPLLPTDHYHRLRSTEAQTAHLPRRASTWVGSTAPPSSPMRHHSSTDDTFSDVAATVHTVTPSTHSPPQNLPRAYVGPLGRCRFESQLLELLPWTLALLLDRLSGRPSLSPSPTIGTSVLARPNHWSGLYFPELPSLNRRHGSRWIHRRFRRHSPRRRQPTGPAPSSRR